MAIQTLEQKLEVISLLKKNREDLRVKGIKRIMVTNDFLDGYDKAIEDIEGILHDN